MDEQNPAPTGSKAPHLATKEERAALHERVKERFGEFGEAPEDQGHDEDGTVEERAILADDFTKPTLRLIAGVFAASLFASFASAPTFDAPGVWANSFRLDTTFVVVWGPLLGWALYRFALTRSVRIYLVLSLFIEPFSEVMLKQQGDGYWDSVLWPAAVAYYGTIKEWSGVPGASLPIFFFATLGLLYRSVMHARRSDWEPPPKFARNVLLVFLGGVAGLSAWGLLHGGTIEGTFRQIQHMMQLPLIALVFLYALRVPQDLAAIGTIFVVTALARSLIVFYVYFGVCMPQGITDRPGLPEWCTTHSDSVLFVVSILILVTHAFEQRTKRAIVRGAAAALVILVAIVLNNRRLAFVSLSVAPMVIYLALEPSRRKRRVTAALALAVPLALAYVLIGSEMPESAIFRPAKLVMSVLDQKDLSSISRDIENENLIYTLKQSPILSTGFGSNYQFSPNNPPVDLSDVFVNYRLIAHNGVLWLWSLGGVVGFTVLWLIFPVSGTLALRGYWNARTALERSAALTALGSIAICVVQIWGDQGINGYMTPVTISVAFAVATRLAMRTG